MSDVTVEELADKIGEKTSEELIQQLSNIGVKVNSPSDSLSDEQVKKLLAMQDKETEDNEVKSSSPKKISLKRKTVSTIKVKRASGKNATVSVVRKKRKVYVKKSPEEAKRLLEEEQQENLEDAAVENAVADNLDSPDSEIGTVVEVEEVKEPEVVVEKEEKTEEVKVEETAPVAKEEVEKAKEPVVKEQEDITVPQVVPQPEVKSPTPAPAENTTSNATSKKKKASHGASEDGEDAESSARKKKKGGKTSVKESKKATDWRREVGAALVEQDDFEEDDASKNSRSKKSRRTSSRQVNPHAFSKPVEPMIYEVNIQEGITVAELAKAMSVKAASVIKTLMGMGVMANINQVVEEDTAILVVEELGHKAVVKEATTIEDTVDVDYEGEAAGRDPVITVMGHVDHGKTTLLDYIRNANVADKERGGITQHMGAYRAKTTQGYMTFLDTPGHSAFTAMRARGANCTDIVILVVAADDGVMPQTKEAIQHAQAANVPIVVAVNKMDKPEADPDRVINELGQLGLMPESWGGDTIFCKISAKEGSGVPELLESVYLLAEMLELQAHNEGFAKGVVLESRLDRGRGPVSTVLVQSGKVTKGDVVIAGKSFGRVRQMLDENGKELKEAGPSIPIEVTGLSEPASAGDNFQVVKDDKVARELSEHRAAEERSNKLSKQRSSQLDGFMTRMQESTDEVKEFNLLVKADVQGSVEVLRETLEDLSTDEFKVRVVSSGVGGFNESDVNLALASEALLIGFNVRADTTARKLAQEEGLSFHYYSIIYDIIDGVKQSISGKLGPKYEDRVIGLAKVRDVFKSSKMGAIAGCIVEEGAIRKGNPIRVLRDNVVIFQGELESLRRFKDTVDEVKSGVECGIGVKQYNDIKPGDHIEVSERVRIDVKL